MAEIRRRARPGRVTWPITRQVLKTIDETFDVIFKDVANRTDVVPVEHGGTGITSVTQGDILYASGANVITTLAKSTTATRYLSNQGTSNNPSWSQVVLTNGVSGVLPIANGGTNNSTFTSGSIIFYDGSKLAEDNAKLLWNTSTQRVTVTTSSGSDTGFRAVNSGSGSSDGAALTIVNGSHSGVFFTTTAAHGTIPSTVGVYTDAANGFVFFPGAQLVTRITTSGLTMASGKTVTLTGFTQGSVLFAGASAVVSEDAAQLHWDATNNRLGIGTGSPGGPLHISSTQNADQAYGALIDARHDTAFAGTVYGQQNNAHIRHSSGTMQSVIAVFSQAYFAATANVTDLTGFQMRVATRNPPSGSATGTVTNATALYVDGVARQTTGTPTVTITNMRGLRVINQGASILTTELVITNIAGMTLENQTNTGGTGTNAVFGSNAIPSGTWNIYAVSTRNNYFAGPLYVGHTTTWGSGTNFISFANGTVPATPPADTGALYTADVVAGQSNIFAINEAGVTNRLTGLHVRKTGDESVASATIQADDHLTINVEASSAYEFEFYGFFTSPATAGINVQLDGTAGVSSIKANIQIFDATGALAAFGRVTAFNSPVGVDGTGNQHFVIRGVIEVSTAGTLFLEWAQNTGDAGNATTVQENSFLVIRKLNA